MTDAPSANKPHEPLSLIFELNGLLVTVTPAGVSQDRLRDIVDCGLSTHDVANYVRTHYLARTRHLQDIILEDLALIWHMRTSENLADMLSASIRAMIAEMRERFIGTMPEGDGPVVPTLGDDTLASDRTPPMVHGEEIEVGFPSFYGGLPQYTERQPRSRMIGDLDRRRGHRGLRRRSQSAPPTSERDYLEGYPVYLRLGDYTEIKEKLERLLETQSNILARYPHGRHENLVAPPE